VGGRGANLAFEVDPVADAVAMLILFLALVSVAATYNAVKRRRDPGPHGPAEPWHRWQPGDPLPARPTSHDLLRERRDRGQVNAEDFDQLLAGLGPDPYRDAPATSTPDEDR
jgi:hypothetical protein